VTSCSSAAPNAALSLFPFTLNKGPRIHLLMPALTTCKSRTEFWRLLDVLLEVIRYLTVQDALSVSCVRIRGPGPPVFGARVLDL
jgi:hypothetical protein